MNERIKEISDAVEEQRQKLYEAERHIWNHAESGFKEWKTSEYLAEQFEMLGYKLTMAGDIPGFYTDIDTGRPGPKILVLGELDALVIPEHPEAVSETGAVHACGHNTQCAALLGVAAALKKKKILDKMCGSIRLCAVPAEEMIELGFRAELLEKGTIHYLTGKAEFLHRGYFEGMDMAFMVHSGMQGEEPFLMGISDYTGSVSKKVTFHGKVAHAAGPADGINALHASAQAVTAINAIRDTFAEEDYIRVHFIQTEGGTSVNTVPDKTSFDMMIRGRTTKAIMRANEKVNRAIAAAAAGMGAMAEVVDRPVYSSLQSDKGLSGLSAEVMKELEPEAKTMMLNMVGTGSTDMGFLSMLMPAIQPFIGGGFKGNMHGIDFYVTDPYYSVILSAKLQIRMLDRLLSDNAIVAKKIIADYEPAYKNKEETLKALEQMNKKKDLVRMESDGTISLNYRNE